MRQRVAANSNRLLAMIAIVIIAGSLIVSDGFFSVDEFVYFLSAEAFANNLSWIISNGPGRFVSEDLVFFNLVSGPNGLVSQYPIGSTVLASPLVWLFGIRGMILVNAASAIGTIFLTRSLARSFFRDETVAVAAVLILVFCTYFTEFAFGIWPHALSSFLVLASIRFCLSALDAGRDRALVLSGFAGLALGLGFLVRAEALLIAPAFGALAVFYADRPIRFLLAGAAGLLPGFAMAGWANWYKFGSANPFSYGAARGGISLGHHQGLIFVVIIVLALFILARRIEWRAKWARPAVIGGLAGLALTWYLIPQVQSILGRYAFGAYNLIADLRLTTDQRPGILQRADGTVAFWGLPKKALGQSLPWLPILLLVFLRPWALLRGRDMVFCLIAFAFWTLPYFLLAWHGGLGSNMRYFHSMLPLIAVLGAAALVELMRTAGSGLRPLTYGYVLGVALFFVWTVFGPGGLFGAHQSLSTYLLLFLTAAAVFFSSITAMTPRLAGVAVGVFAFGMGASTALGPIQDMALAQFHRSENRQTNDALAKLPTPGLFVGPPEDYAFQMQRPEGLVAHPAFGKPVDVELIENALDEGYHVYVSAGLLPDLFRQTDQLETSGAPLPGNQREVVYLAESIANDNQGQ